MRPLRLRSDAAIVPMGNAVQLRAGDETIHVLETDPLELATRVLAMLDGRHDRASLVRAIEEAQGDTAQAGELVDELERRGWLANTDDDARRRAGILDGARLSLHGHAACIDVAATIAAEHGLEVDRALDPGASHPLLCVVERPDLAAFLEVNDACCENARPCLFVDLSHGTHATIGPFYSPHDGACYLCFRKRLHENTAAYAELVAAERQMLETKKTLPGAPVAPSHRHLVLGIATAEIVAFHTRRRPLRTASRAITVDLEGLAMWSEPVLRVPWCRACGTR